MRILLVIGISEEASVFCGGEEVAVVISRQEFCEGTTVVDYQVGCVVDAEGQASQAVDDLLGCFSLLPTSVVGSISKRFCICDICFDALHTRQLDEQINALLFPHRREDLAPKPGSQFLGLSCDQNGASVALGPKFGQRSIRVVCVIKYEKPWDVCKLINAR